MGNWIWSLIALPKWMPWPEAPSQRCHVRLVKLVPSCAEGASIVSVIRIGMRNNQIHGSPSLHWAWQSEIRLLGGDQAVVAVYYNHTFVKTTVRYAQMDRDFLVPVIFQTQCCHGIPSAL